MDNSSLQTFCDTLLKSISQQQFVKLTLAKPTKLANDLKNIYIRLVVLKEEEKLSFTFRHTTNDKVKNYSIEEGVAYISTLLKEIFLSASLFTTTSDVALLISKKGKISISTHKASLIE